MIAPVRGFAKTASGVTFVTFAVHVAALSEAVAPSTGFSPGLTRGPAVLAVLAWARLFLSCRRRLASRRRYMNRQSVSAAWLDASLRWHGNVGYELL
jgi:hypothetical protein